MYRVRIDEVSDLNSDRIIEVIAPSEYLCVRHEVNSSNPHYHLWVVVDSTDKALRQRFQRTLKLKSTDYSVKKCHPDRVDEYYQYLFHNKPGCTWELISSSNVSTERINDAIQRAKDFKLDKKSTKSTTGPTIWDLAQEVQEEIDTLPYIEWHTGVGSGRAEDFPEDALQEKRGIRTYTDIAIKILRKHRKPFDEFLLRKVITTAMTSSQKGKDIMRQKMYKCFCQMY